jgi:NAD(P)-dependent dehydrogenase (short-subunit alcohol dehydrogenase family)
MEQKAAVVTGGADGIGRAIAQRLAHDGLDVAIFDINSDKGERAEKELTEEGKAVKFFSCDVSVESQVANAVSQTLERFRTVDVLVNNAGINAYFDATEMTEQDWDSVFAVDLKAAWLCSKYVIPQMRHGGGGSIVNISSIHAAMTVRGMFPYAAAKSGVVGLTRSLALDYGPDNIRVNAVCPGWVRTNLVQEWIDMQPDPGAAEQSVLSVHPLGRIGTPGEIANFVAFLASDEASFITGAALLVDGGLSARFAT